MSPGFFGRYLRRDTRGARGRLVFFVLCLAVGVAAVVAVAALSEQLDRQLRGDAKRMLGGDLLVAGSRPVPDDVRARAAELEGAELAAVRYLVTMAAVPRGDGVSSALVELKVVDDAYPLYGAVVTDPPGELDTLLAAGGAVVAPELAERFDLAVGDPLRIGRTEATVRGILLDEPDRMVSPFTLGPRVLLGDATFETAGLETVGSRIDYELMIRLGGNPDKATVDAAAGVLREQLGEARRFRVRTYTQASEALRNGLRRVEGFLGLVALLSLLVGGVGVAQSIRAFLDARVQAIAVLKVIGLRPREALLLYLGQSVALGIVGSIVGVVAGLGLHAVAPMVLGDLVPLEPGAVWQPGAAFRGLGLGIGITVLFALVPLISVIRVPPLSALRREAEPLPLPRGTAVGVGLVLVAGLALLAIAQAGSVVRGLAFAGGVVVAVNDEHLDAEARQPLEPGAKAQLRWPWPRLACGERAGGCGRPEARSGSATERRSWCDRDSPFSPRWWRWASACSSCSRPCWCSATSRRRSRPSFPTRRRVPSWPTSSAISGTACKRSSGSTAPSGSIRYPSSWLAWRRSTAARWRR